jgi:hypothetical protein
VVTLMVYNAFHNLAEVGTHGGVIILKKCVFTSGNEVISEL